MSQEKSSFMKQDKPSANNKFYKRLIFPISVLVVYGIISYFEASIAIEALYTSGRVFVQIMGPLTVAFGMIGLLNWLITPEQTKKILGRGSPVKGTFLAAISGIISMGPIYAWYPLLASLRKKGVPDFHLATFLGCRAVKIPLLPVMAAYFGWVLTVILTIAMIVNALLTGLIVEIFSPAMANK